MRSCQIQEEGILTLFFDGIETSLYWIRAFEVRDMINIMFEKWNYLHTHLDLYTFLKQNISLI